MITKPTTRQAPIETNLDEIDEDDIEEELAKIEQNRRHQQLMESRQAVLKIELAKIDSKSEITEQLGEMLRGQLATLDSTGHDRNKLNLLCNDMIQIIRLLISIVRQLKCDEEEKRKRLLVKLEEAKQLRNGINQRRTMFEQRIKRKYDSIVIDAAEWSGGRAHDYHQCNLTTLTQMFLQQIETLFVQRQLIHLLAEEEPLRNPF